MSTIFLFSYRLTYPILWLLAFVFQKVNPKLSQGFILRKNFDYSQLPKGAIWFHCASGEIEYARAVIREIKKQYPEQKIIVSYFSPSVLPILKKIKEIDASFPLVFDHYFAVRKLLKQLDAKCLWIAKTDLWPELLYQCKQANIPSYLFSATLVSGSAKLSNIVNQKFYAWVHSLLSHIYCVGPDDAAIFASLGLQKNCSIAGDTRFAQARFRVQQQNEEVNVLNWQSAKKILLAGSTWSADEEALIFCAKEIKNLAFVFVPHEPSAKHCTELIEKLKKQELSYQLYSQNPNWDGNSILIVDKVGILADLYKKADLAFVGGSFKKSVHSVMESLAAGLCCFVGPYHLNNREAIAFSKKTALSLNLNHKLHYVCPNNDKFEMSKNLQIYLDNYDFNKNSNLLIEQIDQQAQSVQVILAEMKKHSFLS